MVTACLNKRIPSVFELIIFYIFFNKMTTCGVRARGLPFVFGILPSPQIAKLDPLKFRGLLPSVAAEAAGGNARLGGLSFGTWSEFAERYCGLTVDVAWLYFDTYDVVALPSAVSLPPSPFA